MSHLRFSGSLEDAGDSHGEPRNAVALGAFRPSPGEFNALHLHHGERVDVWPDGSGWWYARKACGAEGYVPATFVKVAEPAAEYDDGAWEPHGNGAWEQHGSTAEWPPPAPPRSGRVTAAEASADYELDLAFALSLSVAVSPTPQTAHEPWPPPARDDLRAVDDFRDAGDARPRTATPERYADAGHHRAAPVMPPVPTAEVIDVEVIDVSPAPAAAEAFREATAVSSHKPPLLQLDEARPTELYCSPEPYEAYEAPSSRSPPRVRISPSWAVLCGERRSMTSPGSALSSARKTLSKAILGKGKHATKAEMEQLRAQNRALDAERSRLESALRETAASAGTGDAESSTDCLVCLDRPRDSALVPCGHVLCRVCVAEFTEACPICRSPVDATLRIYGIN